MCRATLPEHGIVDIVSVNNTNVDSSDIYDDFIKDELVVGLPDEYIHVKEMYYVVFNEWFQRKYPGNTLIPQKEFRRKMGAKMNINPRELRWFGWKIRVLDMYDKFIKDELIPDAAHSYVHVKEVYIVFKDWYQQTNPGAKPILQKFFRREMGAKLNIDPRELRWFGWKRVSNVSDNGGPLFGGLGF